MDVGFIGLGKMGQPMVRRLLGTGHTVHVFNRSRGSVDLLAAEGARPAGSAAEVAARAEMVMAALPTLETVEEVFGQLAAAAGPGQIYVDHSTVSPELNRRCAAWLGENGAAFLDAPVTGGPAGAEAGALTLMVGGDEAAFARAEPVFRAFGQHIHLCGPVGAGQALKLVNQLLVGAHTIASAEAVALGARLGVDPQLIREVISDASGSSWMLGRHLPRFIARDFSPATPVSLIVKDLGLVHDEADRAGVPFLVGALAEERFREASTRGLADSDMAALIQLWEGGAGGDAAP